jgi:chromosomal replication initiation ATPase DnaA
MTPDPRLHRRPNHVEAIIQAACSKHGVNRSELLRVSRQRPYVAARRAICRELRERADASMPYIGRMLNISHWSVLHHLGVTEVAEVVEAYDKNAPDYSGEWCI